ncbi:MAG: type 2 isopentenyl-diphosphate Delta-isomerase [Bacteroidetes bacterium]|nr:type 2 isopentenyl-diphosphate Delta-isomerase [Rhodothermia bacterium]MCS7154616.1 type 2 isopentenyl-diphosphate Delta-isomerase [Bacteroidota bacterium]MCX7906333.1 type 2 isopentenyl-diphosphate Delta-isomerase [Bacteroidota bacterium]MDW8137409.1 type 2 isopentenyl-diphosphate Delta-isomerase [Bacteroidota bacterium]MDW8285637.1 type 2 isopentenyl-diphosphate Delta-isomerase [Bacteroidota bacterium]
MDSPRSISARKADHVQLCLSGPVAYTKTTGLEQVELLHCALPELDFEEVCTEVQFLGRSISMPVLVSAMTGGFSDGGTINEQLAEFCEAKRLPLGVGSQRVALEDPAQWETFRVVRRRAPSIPLIGNIGAAEVAQGLLEHQARRLVEEIGADALAVHLNPLQELLQPEGCPRFRGVLRGLERLVHALPVPVIVKETGAGLSGAVARRLVEVGVRILDVSGAGGTSWAAVELLRRNAPEEPGWVFREWGIPTALALQEVLKVVDANVTVIASGGITNGLEVAKCLALGAHLVGIARPFLLALARGGRGELERYAEQLLWQLRAAMFLTGSPDVEAMRRAPWRWSRSESAPDG